MKETYDMKVVKLERKLEDKLMACSLHFEKTYNARGVEKRVLLSTFDKSPSQWSKRRSERIILFLTFGCTVGYQP